MQLIVSIGQAFRKSILVLSLMVFISLSGLFLFAVAPTYASTTLTPDEKIDRAYEYSEATGIEEEERQEAYDEAINEVKHPEIVEKEYEESAKAIKKGEPGLVEKTKELVEKVTGKD